METPRTIFRGAEDKQEARTAILGLPVSHLGLASLQRRRQRLGVFPDQHCLDQRGQ